MDHATKSITVTLSFEKTSLPPFEDVLVLGNNCPIGMNGVGQCLDLLVPDGFEYHLIDEEHIAAIIINKNILKRIPASKIIEILRSKVFPYVGADEIIKVSLTTKVTYDSLQVDL